METKEHLRNCINPVKPQDRVRDLFDDFKTRGSCMFPQQRKIYEYLTARLAGEYVLEAGCGVGLGSAMLARSVSNLVATDVSPKNIAFAKQLYPWISFAVWNIESHAYRYPWSSIVCVEVLEHVANPQRAIINLMASATKEVWLSTPNGAGKTIPPDNPFHVAEYTPTEIIAMIQQVGRYPVTIYHWETFGVVDVDTKADPLIYHIKLEP